MADINSIQPVTVSPDWPYHWKYDNLPLQNLADRQLIINTNLTHLETEVKEARGSESSLSVRLDESLNDDGTLKNSALASLVIDMDSVTDTASYVRMIPTERTKLSNISENATALQIIFPQAPSVDYNFTDEYVKFADSDTITWTIESILPSPGYSVVKAHIVTDHVHYYGETPSTIDYQNYSVGVSFLTGTLRVYINGVRVSGTGVKVPRPDAAHFDTISLTGIDPAAGTFTLSASLSSFYSTPSAYVVIVDLDRN